MKTEDFLRTVFGDSSGFLFLSSKQAPSDTEITIHKAFMYPDSLPTILKYAGMREDEDLYFSPMLFSVPRRRASSVSSTSCLYADTDEFPVEKYIIPPSINIETSPGRHASLWLLDSDYPPEEVAQVSRAIALTHASRDSDGKQTGTDVGGWDLTQLLRLPNSTNLKYLVAGKYKGYKAPYPVAVDDSTSPLSIYSLADITAAYDPSNLPAMPDRSEEDMPDIDDLPSQTTVLSRIMSSPTLSKLYEKKAAPGEDRSNNLYHFVSECLRAGFTAEQTFVVGWYCASNKYRLDGRPRDDFWTYDMRKALADPENRPRTSVDEIAQEAYLHPEDEGISTQISYGLLKEGEFPTRTFVEDYAAWGSSKTDAPAVYHMAGALTILSCLFGDWGVAVPKFGDLNLGLSFLIMGETTKTRKTTARNLMKSFLRRCEDEDSAYILTSDATEEALIDALNQRPNKSSLYDRDEAQKLIGDVKGGKGYMKGFLETLNELYDGIARGRLRVGKQTMSTSVVFVQYLMGIRSQIQENLELSDFVSGWGPRNIYVRGEQSANVDVPLQQQSRVKDSKQADTVLLNLVTRMLKYRDRFSHKCSGDLENKLRVYFDDDAWENVVSLEGELGQMFKGHERFEVLEACFSRLNINAIKVATLLAMSDGRDTVTMQDVINVRSYAARWVEDLIIMVEGVNESLYARDVKNFENFIASKGGLVTTNLAINFVIKDMNKTYKEYIEFTKILEERGVLEHVTDGGKKHSLKLNVP